MQQAWDPTNSIESVNKGHANMLGKGQSGGYPPEATSDHLQSISVGTLDSGDSNGLQVGVQLPGAVQTGPQQNQQLLLTPASLQLAQLQAQLTLHRLKLAQSGNAPAAASVLNQVLSNVNMSQPLFNQLRTSTVVGNPQGAFPPGVLGFPSLIGGGFNQNQVNVRLNQPCSGSMGQQGGEYGKKPTSTYPADIDGRPQFNLAGGTSAASSTSGDGQYTAVNTQAKNMNNVAFQTDFYRQDVQGQPGGFGINEQKVNVYGSTGQKEQWKGHANLPHAGKVDLVSNPAAAWTAAGLSLRHRTELYNPEEPTSDPKLNSSGVSYVSSGTQGFGGYQPLHGPEETASGGTRTLQPYQLNDFHAVTPTQLPHQCSICDKKVYNLKDWDQHVNGKLHLQNRTLYINESSAGVSAGSVHYAVGRSPDGGLNTAGGNSMVCSAPSQDVSSGTNASYMSTAAMKTYPMSDAGFAPHQPESKAFPARKTTVGRVVHICNLPEGSCTENDVVNLGIPFGKVTNYILMRSTHQAFLEMAYVEAAHAMVQYYQLTPAMINGQKLLIRMSKRYKELQLKKPGKDVQSIIQNITSQWERDEMQDHEPYVPERPRSRSPISRSLSPHSHSPSFTSCSSAHSPPGGPCRGPERGSNGMAPHRASWDWSSHRRGEEERERERDDPWRNGSGVDDDRPNGRVAERRKTYHKSSDHLGLRSADERGGEGTRGNRDWHPRGSPQGATFNSYRSADDDFFREQVYKSDKPLRPSYQRRDAKSKRRDGGDYHVRSRHSEFEMSEESFCKSSEDKRQSSPGRNRSKKTSGRRASSERQRNNTESSDRQSTEKSASPQSACHKKDSPQRTKDKETERGWESGEETDDDAWYPKNMEELVTVDEVGEEDSFTEPDLSELEEFVSGPKESAGEEAEKSRVSPSAPPTDTKEESVEESKGEGSSVEKTEDVLSVSTKSQEASVLASELPGANISSFPNEESKTAPEEKCEENDNVTDEKPLEERKENHTCTSEDRKNQEAEQEMETVTNGGQPNNDFPDKGGQEKTTSQPTECKEVEPPSIFHEHDKAVSEHSIPLGVEFIVPRSGFFCKLCGLFYASEETAKSSHCRSTVHYRNLQKYLSQLAMDSLSEALAGPSAAQ